MDPSSKVQSLAFGRFLLLPHRRELLVGSEPVKLGGRAFDVLMALVDARGAVCSKEALLERTWPGQIVEESALQSQVSALRAALGAERDLIRTVSGRGYQFTGEIRALPADLREHAGANDLESRDARMVPRSPAEHSLTNLPAPVSELIGRDHVLAEIQSLLREHRLVTLTGSGGVGKTRPAVAAGRGVLSDFSHRGLLSGFLPLGDAALPSTPGAG